MSQETDVAELVRTVHSRHGQIDILVNNVAVYASLEPVAVQEIDSALWDRIMAVGVRGRFLVAKHPAPRMIGQGEGKIINISSGAANRGQRTHMVRYVTSKGAVIALTRALSRELGEHGICVNTFAPGLVLSDSILNNRADRGIEWDALPSSVSLSFHAESFRAR